MPLFIGKSVWTSRCVNWCFKFQLFTSFQVRKKAKSPKAKAPKPEKADSSKAKAPKPVSPADMAPKVEISADFHLSSLPLEWNIIEDPEPKPKSGNRYSGYHPDGFVLHSGQYEIILIVDMMEVTGGAHGGKQSRKQMKLDELDTLKVIILKGSKT